jgi:hypothetical protein
VTERNEVAQGLLSYGKFSSRVHMRKLDSVLVTHYPLFRLSRICIVLALPNRLLLLFVSGIEDMIRF